MPSIGGQISPQGILIQIAITAPGFVQQNQATGQPINLNGYMGLVDTGASGTCISPKIVADLGLSPIGMVDIQAAAGTHRANRYLIDLLLGFGNHHIVIPNLPVNEFNVPDNHQFQALVGMDVLRKGVFTMTFDGRFTFSM